MAQALFEALAGGSSCTVDNQTAVAVQSLLDSQGVQASTETQGDEEDLFQCGKCKKQFTSLGHFVSHKQSRCIGGNVGGSGAIRIAADTGPAHPVATTFQATLPASTLSQTLGGGYNSSGLTSSPVSQPLNQSMVLTDDLMTFTNLHPTLQQQTIQMVTAPFTNRQPSASVSILSPVTTMSSLSSSASTFTNTVASNQVQIQATPQITITTVQTDKNVALLKPSPTKAGRRSAQSTVLSSISGGVGEDSAKMRKQNKPANVTEPDESAKKKLRCQYCDKLFAKNFDLQQHIRAHTGEKPFQCIVCGRAFAQKSNVKKHMATHKVWPTGSKSTLPKQPPPAFVVEGETSSVSITPNPQENHKVEGESEGIGGGSSGGSEGKMKVVVDSSYICQYCPYKFKTYFQLKTHMVQHKQQQVYKCVMKSCGCTYLDLDSFLEHTKTHEEEMSYRCHMCNKYFASLYELGVHQYTHSLYPNQGPKPGPRHFQCTKCMNKYSSPEALEQHIVTTTHSYACPHCDKVFACERYLRRHLPTHGTEGQFECGQCKKRFKTDNYLKTHMFIHTGEKPYKCDTCAACFNRKDKLKRHVLIHNSVKKYRCPFRSLTGCQKEFNRPDKLKAHIVTHSGIKPFKCKECGKGFSRKPHLQEHERGHKADYKFRCETCGKGFFRPKLFHDHKCQPQKDGLQPQVFRPRHRRKIGRPKKRMISVQADRLKEARLSSNRLRSKERKMSCSTNSESVMDEVEVKTSIPMPVDIDKIHTVTVTNSNDFPRGLQHLTVTKNKQITLKHGVSTEDPLLDHYVVHLTEAVHDNTSTIQTFMPSVSGTQVLHTDTAPAGLQPIAIIEAQPMQMRTMAATEVQHLQCTGAGAGQPMPLMAVSGGGAGGRTIPVTTPVTTPESLVSTQVVVTDTTGGEHTLVACHAHLVDYEQAVADAVQ